LPSAACARAATWVAAETNNSCAAIGKRVVTGGIATPTEDPRAAAGIMVSASGSEHSSAAKGPALSDDSDASCSARIIRIFFSASGYDASSTES
jgi:hypothetical protein